MRKGNYLLIVVALAFLTFGSVSCTYYTNPQDPGFVIPEPEPPDPAFIGSESCAACHQETYDDFITTGHPYILSEVTDATAPLYPNTSIDFIPPFFTNGWTDVAYVIGGYAWKYQFIDSEGYIYTGDNAEYHFATQSAVPYEADMAPGTKQFTCGQCHTTGWVSVDDGGSPQDDLLGMGGAFHSPGVQCEACHGMGAIHRFTQASEDIVVDLRASTCGTCHARNNGTVISAADGFILNYSQYDEMLATGHKDMNCVDCHDPHLSSKYGGEGIVQTCTDCHTDMKNPTHNGADCITCHMPRATKSAAASTIYDADVMTHIFKINSAEDGEMFNAEGTLANGTSGITLAFACYQCHKDRQGVGGENSTKSLSQLAARADGYHD
jgi:hypothetical protein